MRNSTLQNKLQCCLESQPKQLVTGKKKDDLSLKRHQQDTLVSSNKKSMDSSLEIKVEKKESVIVESPHLVKKKIWRGRFNSLDSNIPLTPSLEILDQVLTSNEKDLTPWWNEFTEETSKKLWLPTETDCAGLEQSLLNRSLASQVGNSWFSMTQKHLPNKNSLKTFYPSSQFFPHASPESKPSKNVSKNLKTLSFTLKPSHMEEEKLKMMMNQQRWYTNACIGAIENYYKDLYKERKLSEITVRDRIMRKTIYSEEEENGIMYQIFDYNDNIMIQPDWMKKESVHNRVPRGAISKVVSFVNSCLSNLHARNISTFKLGLNLKKNPTEFLHFEDGNFPSWIKTINSSLSYTLCGNKRTKISFQNVFSSTKKRGLEIVRDKILNTYTLYYPVDIDFFPVGDKRSENQGLLTSTTENRLVGLDPGVRKFLVGYDPEGSVLIVGNRTSLLIEELFGKIDTLKSPIKKRKLWNRIKNLISELHNKTINFLMKNYDTILYPDFRVSQMLRGKKLHPKTKRMMGILSFHSFRKKLEWKCSVYNKNLVIVDESYTSKTCGKCGKLTDVGGNEIYHCESCGFTCGRDINAARNSVNKNSKPK